jgi:hypothetical protein
MALFLNYELFHRYDVSYEISLQKKVILTQIPIAIGTQRVSEKIAKQWR